MMLAAMVVQITFLRIIGLPGAPGSDPGTTSPASACDFTPQGKTANKISHQMMKYTAIDVGSENMSEVAARASRPLGLLVAG